MAQGPRCGRARFGRSGARQRRHRADGFYRDCAGRSAPLNLQQHHAIDLNVPIGCGGVAVYPGDVLVGDDEGVVVIPQHLADEVATDAVEQEKMEAFILERVQNGARLPGTYPPNAETRAAYDAWRKQKAL